MADTVQGKSHTWQLSDTPIGSGDAGEVYAAACIEQPGLAGVLKRPTRIATSGTLQRQAGQIAQEGLALERLDGLPQCKARPPRLLDVAPAYTQGTAGYFIISETASGENFAEILSESRQSGKPFPHRVIITVLDALFDLFARAHRAGVLWNDVKLDHIYWHNPTGQVAVIDWGNAVFLDEDPALGQRALPRWEDYRQFVETLGDFLQHSAPELFADLGWDEFQGKELDSPQVSVLARRIAYQQQVIALRVMEFQSLIQVVLSSDPSLEGLIKIKSYHEELQRIGAPGEAEAVLDYSHTLVLRSLAEGQTQSAIRTATLVWEIFESSLDLPWHLLWEYFRYAGLISHPLLPELASHTLHESWLMALWTLITIAQESDPPDWWSRLIPVLRQKAIGAAAPPPYQAVESLLTWFTSQGEEWQTQAKALRNILDGWRSKGRDLKESPFDYAALDLIQRESNIPFKIRSKLKRSFAPCEEAIRELLQGWVNMDWNALPKVFRRVAGCDPERWGVIRMAQVVTDFQSWFKKLYQGPEPAASAVQFLQELIEQQPPVDRLLGTPSWLNSLSKMLRAVQQGAPISQYRTEVQTWCSWLLKYPDIHSTEPKEETADEAEIQSSLSSFTEYLREWKDIDAGLEVVRASAPIYFSTCKELVERYELVLSVNPPPSPDQTGHLHDELKECQDMLQVLFDWRQEVEAGDLGSAFALLNERPDRGWQIIIHTRQRTEIWENKTAPMLQSLKGQNPCHADIESSKDQSLLKTLSRSCEKLHKTWSILHSSGLHEDWLETLEETIDTMWNSFFEWRQSKERAADRVEHLLYHSQIGLIRQISDNLIELSEQSRQARLSFLSLVEKDEVAKPIQMREAQNLLYHLHKIENLLLPEPERCFSAWINTLNAIVEAETHQQQRELALALPEDHPLFTWLVQSYFA